MWIAVAACAAAPPVREVPYGFWGLNGYLTPEGLTDLKSRTGLTVFQTATTDTEWAVTTLLPMARDAGLKVTLRLTGDHPRYTRDGNFDLSAWKAMLSRWDPAILAPFVGDGTLAGHMLLDDIHNWTGADPTFAELEELARFSKERLPGLYTFVRENASEMPAGEYAHLDACVNQYRALDGDVDRYAHREAAIAAKLGLDSINGLNIANGGDGSSQKPGWQAGRFAMSAAEIERYGKAMRPGAVMFLNWEYDGEERWADGTVGAEYFRRPDVEAALRALGTKPDGR